MSKFLLTLAFAAVTLVSAALPSKAVPYVGSPLTPGTNLGSFPAALNSESFGDNGVAGGFATLFEFTLTSAASVEFATASNGIPAYITGMTLNLLDSALLLLSTGVNSGFPGISNLLSQGPLALAAGVYYLEVAGTAPAAGAVYAGTVSFSFDSVPNDVPLPGAVYLFGTIIAGGFGGMQLMRRRRAQRVAA